MSKDEMRSNLNGVFLHSEKNDEQSITAEEHIMRMVATDGNRLSLMTLKGDGSDFLNVDDGIILPRKGVGEIRKLVESGSDYVEIGVKGGICVLRKDSTVLRVSLIDSKYPDYKKVVPVDSGILITLDRDQFLHSLRLMSVVSSEKNWGVRIKIMEGSMALNLTNADIGEANEEIDISYKGEEIEAAYNVNYLIDAIQVIKGKDVSFEMRAGLRPCVISEAGNDSYISVIMPLKI
jgi:DNA polymerase-3 subunit beta